MELHECILTRNDCCRRGTPLVPRGVMVHSTGANNPYLRRYVQPDDGELGKNRYDNDWNRPGLPVCVHAFLGKKAGGGIAVYQTLPWEVQAWHCGRSGNRTHLAFEICEDGLDDRAYFTAVEKEAEDLTLQELDARIDARIRTVLEGTGSRASSWAQEELARAMAHGITDGTRPGGYATREEVALMAERVYSGRA